MCFLNMLLSPSLTVAVSRLSESQVNNVLQSASVSYSRLKQGFTQDQMFASHSLLADLRMLTHVYTSQLEHS